MLVKTYSAAVNGLEVTTVTVEISPPEESCSTCQDSPIRR